MELKLAPKSQQPKGGFMGSKHLLAFGPIHMAWNAGQGWHERNTYSIAPNASIYEARLLNN